MSPFEVALGLLRNLVAVTLCIVSIGLIRAAFWKRNQIIPGWLLGVLFAGAAFVGLLFPVAYSPGVIRDFRNSLIALSAFYGGFPAGIVSACLAGGYRLYLGGGGALGGILGLFSSAVVGHFFRNLPPASDSRQSFWRLFLLGIFVFAITFMWSWTLPKEQVIKAVGTFFFPELIAYPLVTALFGILYQLETDRQRSMDRFRAVFKESPLGILVLSTSNLRIIDVNPAFCRMIGYTAAELLKCRIADIVHPTHREEAERFTPNEPPIDPQEFKGERRFLKKTGEGVWLNVAAAEIRDQDSRLHYAIAVIEDITDRKRAEEALQQYLRRLQILHKSDQAILKAQSTETIIHESLRYVREMIPCQRTSVMLFDMEARTARIIRAEISRTSRIKEGSVISLDGFSEVEGLLKGIPLAVQDLSALSETTGLLDTLRKEGTRSYLMIPLVVHDRLIGTLNLGAEAPGAFDPEKMEIAGEVANSLAVAVHNTQLVEETMRHREELKRMSALILQAQEAERKRISIELHDEMGQAMTGISLNLAVIERSIRDGTDHLLMERLAETRLLADRATDQIRDMSFHLRPSILDDLGLEPALRWYIGRFAKRMNLQARFEAVACEGALSPETKTVLYRVVQEALNNVAKHADARRIGVRLSCNDHLSTLVIEDDGRGFDAAGLSSGLGLIGIRERIDFLNGTFRVESLPNCGTRLVVSVPMETGDSE